MREALIQIRADSEVALDEAFERAAGAVLPLPRSAPTDDLYGKGPGLVSSGPWAAVRYAQLDSSGRSDG